MYVFYLLIKPIGFQHLSHLILFERPSEVMTMEKEDATKREKWGGKMEYILVMLGSSVGFGNFWRFPYVCARNGGGMLNQFNL